MTNTNSGPSRATAANLIEGRLYFGSSASVSDLAASTTPLPPGTGVVDPTTNQFLGVIGASGALTPIGGGSVTSVSVTTANGVSGSVATATTTPAITLALGAISPTSVGTGAVTASGDATLNAKAYIAASSGIAVMADATGNRAALEIQNGGSGGPAMLSFLRAGLWGAYLGLDTDSKFKIGGWSYGAFAYEILHAGNVSSFAVPVGGNAGTATALATARAINGVNFDGTAAITVTAAAGTLTGATLAANVLASSLTSVGTLTGLTVTAPIAGSVTGSADTVTGAAQAAITSVGTLTGLQVGSAATTPGVTQLAALLSSDTAAGTLLVVRKSNADGTRTAGIALIKSAGTAASPTTVASGDGLGILSCSGHDGTNYTSAGSMQFNADAAVSAGVVPGRIVFNTNSATGVSAERMRISSAGIITIAGLPALSFADDTAAAAGGVPIGGLYNATGLVRVRLV